MERVKGPNRSSENSPEPANVLACLAMDFASTRTANAASNSRTIRCASLGIRWAGLLPAVTKPACRSRSGARLMSHVETPGAAGSRHFRATSRHQTAAVPPPAIGAPASGIWNSAMALCPDGQVPLPRTGGLTGGGVPHRRPGAGSFGPARMAIWMDEQNPHGTLCFSRN